MSVLMEDIDVSDCPDDTFLPDFGYETPKMATDTTVVRKPFSPENDDFNERLRRAERKSESENSLTPVVKEELRCLIAARRHQQGKRDIQVEFKEPVQYPLTAEEIKKKERRREQNRRAATKCRKKKKEAKVMKETEMQGLKIKNEELQDEVTSLRSEVQQLKQILAEHETSGQCRMANPPSFMSTIPVHHYDAYSQDESELSDTYSPNSSTSFFPPSFTDANMGYNSCYEYNQHQNVTVPLTMGVDRSIYGTPLQLNGTIDLTPPVSPNVPNLSTLTSYSECVDDPELASILNNMGEI